MASNPVINPQDLSQLHDIHLPAPIGWWPLAPGWYLLAALTVLIGFSLFFMIHRAYSNGRAKRQALRELAQFEQQYQQDTNSQLASARLSELLKRVALAYYPRTQVAGLRGEAWIAFLNSTGKGLNFNSVRVQLLELPYQPIIPRSNLHLLFKLTRKWIKRRGKLCSS